MSDFTTLNLQYNTNTDASPTWTGTAIAFGGTSGANEIRWAPGSGATAATGSAAWPFFTRPTSGTSTVPQLWAFSADTTGSQIATYTGDNTKANVLRWNWDNTGTFASAPQFSAFGDNTHTAPSAGTQPGGQSGSPIVNGHASDTSSMSYLKYNAYGSTSTSSLSAGAVGTNPSATTGNQGTSGVNTCTASNWLNSNGGWQDAQGWLHYVVLNTTPAATTAGSWNWTCILFTGANMSTGTLLPCVTFQYTFS